MNWNFHSVFIFLMFRSRWSLHSTNYELLMREPLLLPRSKIWRVYWAVHWRQRKHCHQNQGLYVHEAWYEEHHRTVTWRHDHQNWLAWYIYLYIQISMAVELCCKVYVWSMFVCTVNHQKHAPFEKDPHAPLSSSHTRTRTLQDHIFTRKSLNTKLALSYLSDLLIFVLSNSCVATF